TTRALGSNAAEEAYRITSRVDRGNGIDYNRLDFTYNSDVGSTYQDIASFGVTLSNGQKSTIFNYRKDYVDETTPTVIYTNSITEATGNESRRTSFQYDETRRLTTPTVTTSTFTKAGSSTAPMVNLASYDDYGNVLSRNNTMNMATTYTYNPTSRLLASVLEKVDATQTRLTSYVRNDKGKITEIIVTNQNGTKLAHSKYEQIDAYGNVGKTTVLDDVLNTEYYTTYGYSGAFPTQQSILVTDADGQSTTIVNQLDYDPTTGRVKSFTDGKNNTTTYVYDKLGRLKTITHPDQSSMSAVYDDIANQVTVTDETGVTGIQKWDALGHKMEEGIIDGSYRVLKQYGYDSLSRLIWEQNGSGHRTQYQYDGWGRGIQTTLPNGAYSATQYDELNRTMTSTDPAGVQSRSTADMLGREILSQLNKGGGFQTVGSVQYDDMGNVIVRTDAQHTTRYQYDALGRLTGVTDPKNDTTSYAYSLAGHLKEIRYPDANTTQKRYDQLGRLIKQTDAMGQVEKSFYDANSNVVRTVDQKGQQFTFQYNNRNRLTLKSSPNDSVGYTYDPAGRRKTMTDPTGTTSYAYKNTTGELREVTFPDLKKISYTYNSLGLRETMTDPFGYMNVYTYDNMNRLKTVGPSLTTFDAEYDYYNNSLLKEIRQLNGNKSKYTYDGYAVDSLIHKKANNVEINSFNYDYDGNGNLTNQSLSLNGQSNNYSYSYDPLNRIATSSQ
ncbi:hypothetical protein K0T92_24405, partial [Paenibacillus oenotherae]|nr:hypothetical protein [Paenibacillus oenotherae]